MGKYELVDHQENDPTGFSASLWQSKDQSSQYVLSLRGTDEPLQDTVIEDGLYVFRQGYARRQLVSLNNYYNRLIAPEGSSVTQLRIIETAQPSARLPSVYDRLSGRYITLIEASPATGLGAIPAGAGISLDVTGHSLGAHLTLGFSRLFTGVYNTATTFNAPGYEPVREVDDFFRAFGGAAQFPVAGVTNLDGLEGPLATSIISDLRRRPKPGGRQFVFIEDQIDTALALLLPQGAFNHSQSLLTDSMGLYAQFGQVDASAGIERISNLLNAASNRSPKSLEAALDGLRALFRVSGWETPTPINGREGYYSRLFALDDLLAQTWPDGAGNLQLVGELGESVLAQGAKESGGIAYRYALRHLNPYVVAGAEALPAYTEEAASLALSGSGGAAGSMSAEWIDKRSELLARVVDRNAADRSGQRNLETYAADPVDYRWTGADGNVESMRFAFGLFAADDPRIRQVAFGSERNDTLKGSNKDDSLFGEGGNDRLIGLAGTDQIEGGAGSDEINGGRGDDTLIGGDGFDTYVYKQGDGQDRIIDSDRKGRIVLDTDTGRIALGNWVADGSTPNTWRTADGLATLTHNSPWTVSFSDGGSIVLGDMLEADDFSFTLDTADDFADGYTTVTYLDEENAMAIEDDAERQAALLARQSGIAGDTHYFGGPDAEFWDDLSGSNLVELAGGDDTARLGAEDDIAAGGDGRDAILGGAGNDHVFGAEIVELVGALESTDDATGEQGDTLADSTGNDWLIGGAGDDLISGGDGNDLLIGAAGDDHIYGDDYFPMAVADSSGNPVSWSFDTEIERQHTPHGEILEAIYRDTGDGGNDEIHGGSGHDWINAGSGDDVVYGDAGDDYLVGGTGSDAVFGGDGDDWLIADGIADFSPRDEPDYLDGGDGNDLIVGNEGDNVIFGGGGDDEILAGGGNNIIDGGEGADTITADSGEETAAWVSIVHGGAGDDDIVAAGELYGDEGNDMISGAAPGDELYGGAGNDLLISGGADSHFDGGDGDDVYSLGLESGRSTISDSAGNDTIELASFDLSDDPDHETIADSSLRLTVENERFVLHYGELGDSVEFFDDSIAIERVRIVHEFESGDVRVSEILLSSLPVEGSGTADGDVITAGPASAISLHAGDGDDIAYGTAGGDEFYGEAGDDVLIGGAGADVYHFARDSGQDRIIDIGGGAAEADRIVLESIRPTDVSVFTTEGFLLLRVADNGGEIIVDWDASADTGVERVAFDDATEWNRDQLLARAQPLEFETLDVLDPDPSSDGGDGSGGVLAGQGDASTGTGTAAGSTEPVLLFGDASDAFGSGGLAGIPGATGTRNTTAARGLAATDSGAPAADLVAIAAALLPIEAFFNRVTPPPMPVQQWLDNWVPSGARAASGSSESGTERVTAPSGDAPPADSPTPSSSSRPSSPAPSSDDAASIDMPPDEIARRYARIDAWLAEDEVADPDDRIGAGATTYAYGMPGDGSVFAPADSGLNLRIASGGLADLSAGAMRPFRGLDEGFTRLG